MGIHNERPIAKTGTTPNFAPGMTEERGWMERLAARWNVSSGRVLIILFVFACTGFTVMFLKRPIVDLATGSDGSHPLWFSVVYYLLILPFYNLILLVYGALLGQFRFFWEFEKRFFNRLLGRKGNTTSGGRPGS